MDGTVLTAQTITVRITYDRISQLDGGVDTFRVELKDGNGVRATFSDVTVVDLRVLKAHIDAALVS